MQKGFLPIKPGVLLWSLGVCALAQAEVIYRCGNTYTNRADSASCVALPNANVTVIEGTQVYREGSTAASSSPVKVDPSTQNRRDASAQQVLEVELQKAQSQQAQIQKQLDTLTQQAHQNADQDKHRSQQQALQQALERSQADVNALQRELLRVNQGAR